MSNRLRRPRGGASPTAALNPKAYYGTNAAWARDRTCVEEAKKQSHDLLVELMGRRRTGGVQWRIARGPDATVAIGLLLRGTTGEQADAYREIQEMLRTRGGFLVIAMAEGVGP